LNVVHPPTVVMMQKGTGNDQMLFLTGSSFSCLLNIKISIYENVSKNYPYISETCHDRLPSKQDFVISTYVSFKNMSAIATRSFFRCLHFLFFLFCICL